MKNELKPCRLCGNKDVYITQHCKITYLEFEITCLSCKIKTPIYECRDKLIKEWNNNRISKFISFRRNIKFTRFEIMEI